MAYSKLKPGTKGLIRAFRTRRLTRNKAVKNNGNTSLATAYKTYKHISGRKKFKKNVLNRAASDRKDFNLKGIT